MWRGSKSGAAAEVSLVNSFLGLMCRVGSFGRCAFSKIDGIVVRDLAVPRSCDGLTRNEGPPYLRCRKMIRRGERCHRRKGPPHLSPPCSEIASWGKCRIRKTRSKPSFVVCSDFTQIIDLGLGSNVCNLTSLSCCSL